MNKYIFNVDKNIRLLKFLNEMLPQYKYSALEMALRKKDIKINNVRTKENIILKEHDVVEIFLQNEKMEQKYQIVYEDENVILFDKGKGIEVCDGEYNIQNEYFLNTKNNIYPLHRIDRNTIGLVMFAKNEKAFNELLHIFKKHNVIKYYYAVVKSGSEKEQDVLKSFLLKDKKESFVKIFDEKKDESLYIETFYKKITKKEDLALLDVCIKAGKTHQIRAHLSHFNMPILGDGKYGDNKFNKEKRQKTQLLQAYKLKFSINKDSFMSYLNDKDFSIKCKFNDLF